MAGEENENVDGVVDDSKNVDVVAELTLEDEELKAAEDAVKEASKGTDDTKSDEIKTEVVETAKPAQADETKEEHTVPVSVFNSMRKQMQGHRDRSIYLEGQNAALTVNQQQSDNQETEVVLTPEEQIAELRQQKLDIAKEFDDGDVSEVEKQKKYLELEDAERKIRAEQQAPGKAATAEPSQDLALENHRAELYKTYPSLAEATTAQLAPLREIAEQKHFAANGSYFPETAQGTADLQTAVAKLHQSNYGTPATTQTDPGKQETANSGELSDLAKAREQKLKLAGSHPVDTSELGTTSESGVLSDEQVEARLNAFETEDEQIAFIDANPALKQRLGL